MRAFGDRSGKREFRKVLACLIILVLSGLLFLVQSCALRPPLFDEAEWRAKVMSADSAMLYAPHFKNGRFFNPWLPNRERGFLRFLKWRFSSGREYTQEEIEYRPGFIKDAGDRIRAMPQGDFILWVGHGTFLIRLNGEYWLTDPMFSKRAFLPKRKTPPAITPETLGKIAPRVNVILSHNHYDHLDRESILGLPENTRFYVPLGLRPYLRGMNKSKVTEMDWWQTLDTGKGITLVCLPAQHWSRRIGQGVNETLWASYMLIAPGVTIYFGGDSGYFIGYREIGKRYPGIDYALLPTTAYQPRWFMHHSHMNIDETIQASRDLKARFMIPHQWGAFHLGDEPVGYSILELKKTIAGGRLDPSRFLIMDIGEIRRIPKRPHSISSRSQ
jgi:N-acyl-phosphatidylethanolamine-hydrolysing phospholipase D